MYQQTTSAITVQVQPFFLDDQSQPAEGQFVWAYHIRIENGGAESVQLESRYWKITDAHGRVREVRGPGVVGEQPVLQPGAVFEYTSGAPLETPSGFMTGSYQMRKGDGTLLEVAIPTFSLDSPYESRQLH